LIGSFCIAPALLGFIILSAIARGHAGIIDDYVHGDMRKLALLFLNSSLPGLVHRLCLCDPDDVPLRGDLT
jgi:succinate dehydrogenase / fumarate reductase membrane anchor subunit